MHNDLRRCSPPGHTLMRPATIWLRSSQINKAKRYNVQEVLCEPTARVLSVSGAKNWITWGVTPERIARSVWGILSESKRLGYQQLRRKGSSPDYWDRDLSFPDCGKFIFPGRRFWDASVFLHWACLSISGIHKWAQHSLNNAFSKTEIVSHYSKYSNYEVNAEKPSEKVCILHSHRIPSPRPITVSSFWCWENYSKWLRETRALFHPS